MNRRTFLGLIGTSLVAAATPTELMALAGPATVPAAGPAALVDFPPHLILRELMILPREPGLIAIRRASDLTSIIEVAVEAGRAWEWQAMPSQGIVFPQGIASLVIDGPEHDYWGVWEDRGRALDERGRYTITAGLHMPTATPQKSFVIRHTEE